MQAIYIYSDFPICLNTERFGLKIEIIPLLRSYGVRVTAQEGSTAEAERGIMDLIFLLLIKGSVRRALKLGSRESESNDRITDKLARRFAGYLSATGAKQCIEKSVRGLLSENAGIHIEGMLNFRLRCLTDSVEAFMERLLREYQIKKCHDDFIAMVREYIEAEIPKTGRIHVAIRNQRFYLYDTGFKDLTRNAVRRYRVSESGAEIGGNDFLVSSLLELLPEEIIIHRRQSTEVTGLLERTSRILKTLEGIFADKVIYCDGGQCRLCGANQADEVIMSERFGEQ